MKKIFTLAFSILMVSQLFAAAEFFVKSIQMEITPLV